MKIIWSPEAVSDLKRLHDFIKCENPRAALLALIKIKEDTTKLADFPDIGVQICGASNWRELYIPFGHQAYVVRYTKYSGDKIFIIRVWHSRENRLK